jgi:hypothetical protein
MTFAAVAVKNAALDAINFTHASLHTDYPGTTGANEVVGGSYARKAITVNAASAGVRLLNAGVTFDIPACTVKWIGFWDGVTFLFAVPNGGATPKNFMAVPTTDIVYATGHGWSDTQKVVSFGVPPTGVTEGVTIFVRDATTDTFKLSLTSGGTAIDLSAAASFGCVLCAIQEDVYGSPDTHSLTLFSFVWPD